MMIVGRLISGFGVGLLSYVTFPRLTIAAVLKWCCRTIVPIYQSEISPPNHVCFELFSFLCFSDESQREVLLHAWNSPGTSLVTLSLS